MQREVVSVRARVGRRLLTAAALLCACSPAIEERCRGSLGSASQVVESTASPVVQAVPAVGARSLVYPSQLTLGRGKVSAQPLSVLAVQDQTGSADTWERYLEFTPEAAGLSATFTFTLPASVDVARLGGLTLLGSFKGQLQAAQDWRFELYDPAQARWLPLGDNRGVQSWVWSALSFSADAQGAPVGRFVSAERQIRVRMQTLSGVDACNLDYLALALAPDGGGAVTPAPPEPKPMWRPAPGTTWQVQFSGSVDTSLSVKVFDLDLEDTTKATIDALHGRGIRAICYISGGSHEEWRPDAGTFPSGVLGAPLAGWPGERWLDVRQIAVLRPIMERRLDRAVQKGCDAIDSDNMDGYLHPTGFGVTYAQQLAYNRMVADAAHARGMSIGLKNDLEQVADLADVYDFAINEQCAEYHECERLAPFITRNKAVFGIEFAGSQSSICSQANRLNHDTLIKKLALDGYRVSCR